MEKFSVKIRLTVTDAPSVSVSNEGSRLLSRRKACTLRPSVSSCWRRMSGSENEMRKELSWVPGRSDSWSR